MKRRSAAWTAVAIVLVAGNLVWAAASGAGDSTDDGAGHPGLPIKCGGGNVVYGFGYAGLGPAEKSVEQAIDAYLATEGATLTSDSFVETEESVLIAVEGQPAVDESARVFVDETGRAALYLEETVDGWRVEANVVCESFAEEELT